MIEHLKINFIHMEPDEKLQKYIEKKIGRIERYIPRSGRENVRAEVQLKENKADNAADCCASITMHLPHEVINVTETSMNMYTAIDILELKLKQKVKKYKDLHHSGALKRRLATRLAR